MRRLLLLLMVVLHRVLVQVAHLQMQVLQLLSGQARDQRRSR